MQPHKTSSGFKALTALLFAASGTTGLIYQIVWYKYLALFFGNTIFAQMTVLSVFMGGLAVGNYFSGLKADKLNNPLLVYSLLEIIIGLYCFAYPALHKAASAFFISAARDLNLAESGGALLMLFRAALAVLLLTVPTVAAGAAFPLTSRFFVNDIRSSGTDTAVLYALNSLGAAIGVLLAGFYLIDFFGLNFSLYFGAAVNICIGAVGAAAAVMHRRKTAPAVIQVASEITGKTIAGQDKIFIFALVLTSGMSGFAAMVYEMVLGRYFIHIFGSSTYAFSSMLMAFIGGITIGSLIAASKFIRNFNTLKTVAFSQAAIAFTMLPVLFFYERIMYYFWVAASMLVKTDTTYSVYLFLQTFFCFISLVLPAVFMGISLPLITGIVAESKNEIAGTVGKVFSANILGTVLGSLAAGLVLIPFYGIKTGFLTGIFINLAAAALITSFIPVENRITKLVPAGIFTALFLLIVTIIPGPNIKASAAGVYRRLGAVPSKSYEVFIKSFEKGNVLFYEEGSGSNVAVIDNNDGTGNRALFINGNANASNTEDMPTLVLLGQIPLLLHGGPEDVFVAGLGSGITAGSVLSHDIKNLVCAEISEEVVAASAFFTKENNNCLKDSRFRLRSEDARTVLELSPRKYDVIISDPYNPWMSGSTNMFSAEFFELCRSRLNRKGIMAQWFQMYDMDDEPLLLLLNTFSSVFPNSQLWASKSGDVILIGSEEEIQINPIVFHNRFYSPAVLKNLKSAGINTPFTLLSNQVLSPDGFYALSGYNKINSDLHPLLEFSAPKALFKSVNTTLVYDEDERFKSSVSDLLVEDYIEKFRPDSADVIDAIRYLDRNSASPRLIYSFSKYLTDNCAIGPEVINYLLGSAAVLKLYDTPVSPACSGNKGPGAGKLTGKIYWKSKIRGEAMSASFLRKPVIVALVDSLLKFCDGDSISDIKNFTDISNLFTVSDDLINAYLYAEKVRKLAAASPDLTKNIEVYKFIHNATISSIYMRNYKLYLSYLFTVMSDKDLLRKRYTMRLGERLFKKTETVSSSGTDV